MLSNLRSVLFLLLVLTALDVSAQAPTISYSGPQSYPKGTTVTPLLPVISPPVTIASGFHNPNGIAVDGAGNIYVADPDNNQVDKIPAGGGAPFAIGTGISIPYDVTLDAAGNVYVADFGTNKIKKIPAGGGATVVLFSSVNNPGSVAIDPAGNIYTTALFGSNTVSKFPVGGGPVTTVGSGFNDPQGIAIDASGNIYIADAGNNAIKKIPAGGGSPISIGTGFNGPWDVAVDAKGNVYVADTHNQVVKEIVAATGATITIAAYFPVSNIAVDGSGNVFITDDLNVVREIKPITSFSINPQLPAGLSMDPVTGIISGTPTVLSAATNYTITAHYNLGTTSTILNIGVITPPPISVSPVSGNISACSGMASASPYIQQFTVAGTNLSANVAVTAPAGFEISLAAGSGYSGTIILPETGGAVNSTIIYVRSAASAIGNISGSVTLASAGSPSQNVVVSGSVKTLPAVNAVPDQTVLNGAATTGVNFTATGGVSWINNAPGIGLAPSGSGDIASFNAVNMGSIPVTATITATPVAAGFAYLLNSSPNTVSALNTATNTIVATIPLDARPGGAVVSPDGSTLYVSIPFLNEINVINTATNSIVTTFSAGGYPGNMVISPDGNRLYVENINTISVINTATNSLISTIAAGTNESAILISPDGNWVYVMNYDHATVSVINTTSNSVTATIAAGANPIGGALSPDGARLYVVNANTAGTVSVINTLTNTLVSTIPISTYSYAAAISPDGSKLYVTTANYTNIAVINTATNSVTATITGATGFRSLLVSLDGSRLYALDSSTGRILVLNTETNTVVATVTGVSSSTSISNITTLGAGCSGAPVTFTITVTPPPITNAGLANLDISSGSLAPSFATTTFNYSASVANAIGSIKLTPTLSEPTATVKVNGKTVVSGSASVAIPLIIGFNTINVIVTAQDGITTRTYTIIVTRAASPNANLNNLHLSNGTLSPSFQQGTINYTTTVPNSLISITVTPTTSNASAAVEVNGTPVASGTASQNLPLSVGPNVITTIVTAPDGTTTKTYTITVTRAASANANLSALHPGNGALSPAFAQGKINYTVSVANAVSTITVTPTAADATATIKVNGIVVSSGSASGSLPLVVGPNVITAVVTAPDGTTTKTYTLTVTRAPSVNANLSALVLSTGTLSPVFTSGHIVYTAAVGNSTAAIKVTPTATDATATIKVNGKTVVSGAASANQPLLVGPNTITTIVTAQDGTTTKTYTVTITRAPSGNANLAGMHPSAGALSPSFSPATTNYTEAVANSVTAMTITPSTADATATIKVNGTPVTSGTASQSLPLSVGSNIIATVVTAQDGTTTKTYTLTVTRATGPLGIATPQNYVAQITAEDGITVHPGVSPNGDGMEDGLTIDGITNYPDNKLTIMNRSGVLVFEAKGYDNSFRVFNGHSSKTGKLQQPGTYFYSLEYKVGGVTKRKTGFIVLKY